MSLPSVRGYKRKQRCHLIQPVRKAGRLRQAGFTLFELLIAMSISVVLAVVAYQTIAQVVKVDAAMNAHQERLEQQHRAIWWIEQDMIQMVARPIQDGLGGQLPAMQLQTGLEWTRTADFMTPWGRTGLMRVGYQLQDNQLQRVIWPVIDRVPDTQPQVLSVLEEVKSLSWRFLDHNNQWQLSWPPPEFAGSERSVTLTILPKAVEFEITLTNGERLQRLFRGTDGVGLMFLTPQTDQETDQGTAQVEP